ncbi:FAD-dependent oxidoreductase [Amycolatopsis regifaucium]|uniref:FAD-dependent oxidoreductase n=1 Tax=Amycolatopsis regifaucium TaxID=546365 RepID=A0A154MKC7_9PSEU|nr:NAD(P)/FAD-dependent oxidoreductase [Amycolatopsis regifaucium]KZB84520.1 FAD-dependent oxidoreductase [Amycolatopsis regifaucium]OKA10983.1 FAD-dependent oxidoreductase [Amycolatopsis regifaucium]SFI24297.1 2-polyprenyl-6-methoxyphenol hydroxylase [Amycolatopsis regifaucium]
MRAVIIGGGIAGTVTAMALRRAGIDASVHEAYPSGGEDAGAFLTIMHNGMDALRAIGAEGPVVENSFGAVGLELVTPDGRTVDRRSFDIDGLAGPRTMTRASLYRTLQEEAISRGIAVERGKRLVAASPGIARFEDGSTAEGDILIGADGLRSVVRTIIDPDCPPPRSTGLDVVYGYTTDTSVPQAPSVYRMVQSLHAFFGYTSAPDGSTYWFARLPAAEGVRVGLSAAEWRAAAFAAFDGEPLPAAEIIRSTGDDVFGGHSYDVPLTPVWSTASMVLVGDAAHAASPAAGQGASMALEDSVVLAKCLRDLPDAPTAFAAYERLRRARVEKLVASSAALSSGTTSDEGRNWLYQHHIEWDETIAA